MLTAHSAMECKERMKAKRRQKKKKKIRRKSEKMIPFVSMQVASPIDSIHCKPFDFG